jgi:hypothetical protein
MDIILGYDTITHNGPLPNCLNPKFIPTIKEGCDYDYNKCFHHFNEKWGCDYCLFNSHDLDKISKIKSVSDIVKDRNEGNEYKWFYIVEPHSGLDLFFGLHKVHDKFALTLMSETALDELKYGNGNLLINYTIDGGLGVNIENFSLIVDFTRRNEIPDEKVYFIFSDFKLKENFERIGVNYNVMDSNFYLPFKAREFESILKGEDKTNSTVVTQEDFINNIETDKKDFLLLSRHFKLHRIMLLNKLHRMGLDNNLVSWEKTYYNGGMVEEMLKRDNNLEFAELLKTTSKHLDVDDIVNVWGYGFEDKNLYLNTYISLVTETIFFQSDWRVNEFSTFPTGFISEKIWKPIGHCQPFILAGPAKSLKYIKSKYGFKTFHPYIDESYDNECNDIRRIELIENEIERFSKKTKSEKIEFLNNVKDICFHNQNLFISIGEESRKEFPESLKEKYLFLNHTKSIFNKFN